MWPGLQKQVLSAHQTKHIHTFTCGYANKLKFASFIILCVVSHITKFYTSSIHTGWDIYPITHRIKCADKTCFCRPGHILLQK